MQGSRGGRRSGPTPRIVGRAPRLPSVCQETIPLGVDEAGVPSESRIQFLMDMRNFLLHHYNPVTFPPPGAYVKGLPIAQFEGLLINIDRRIYHLDQLSD